MYGYHSAWLQLLFLTFFWGNHQDCCAYFFTLVLLLFIEYKRSKLSAIINIMLLFLNFILFILYISSNHFPFSYHKSKQNYLSFIRYPLPFSFHFPSTLTPLCDAWQTKLRYLIKLGVFGSECSVWMCRFLRKGIILWCW